MAITVFPSLLRQIKQLLELLTTEVLNPDSQAPNGVKSHFLEIFLEELTKVGAAEVKWALVRSVGCGACAQRRIQLPSLGFSIAHRRPESAVHRPLLPDSSPHEGVSGGRSWGLTFLTLSLSSPSGLPLSML